MVKHNADHQFSNPFQRCWQLGYHNLLPVVPPDGGISNAGKRPGVKQAGKWSGRRSGDFTATLDTIASWAAMGASVGFSCNPGTGFCGIDIDTLSAKWADHIVALAHEMLGPAPRRIGRSPKVLLPYNCPADLRYAQVRFRDDRPAIVGAKVAPGLVECLSGEAKWFVALGIHPQTKRAYEWPDGLWERARLTTISLAQRDAFLEQLRMELPEAAKTQTGTAQPIDPARLRGDEKLVAEAMRAIPNDPEITGYEQWRNIAAALRGAVPYEVGLELFEEWTEKAEIETPTERADRVFASLDEGNLRLGADYIFHQAERAGWRGFAASWFSTEVEPEEQPYESIFGGGEDDAVRISASDFALVDPLTIPPRDFLYGTHIVRRFASMTVAPSKVGKSSLATVDALAMVTGRTLLPHMRPKGQLRVWYINGEDPLEELQRRFVAAALHYGITNEDIGDRLKVDSGRSLRLVTVVEDKSGVTVLRPVTEALILELKAQRIDVLTVDPFVSSHRVRENDNSSIEIVVAEWIRVADEAGVAIEFVHHARKASAGDDPDATVDAARGASAMVAKMRSVRALARMTRAEGKKLGLTTAYRHLFRVTDAASNLAPWVDDETEWLKLDNVDLGNGAVGPGSSETVEAARWREGDHVAVVVAWSAGQNLADTTDDRDTVLQALGLDAWREDIQARDEWIGKAIAAALNLDLGDDDDREAVKRMVKKLIHDRMLVRFQQQDQNRKKRWYVKAASVLD